MREGKWSVHVKAAGSSEALPEHSIEGRTCIESTPGSSFVVDVQYHGSEMHLIALQVDGRQVSNRKAIDGSNSVTFPMVMRSFKGWEKSQDGQRVTSDFVFLATQTGGGDDDDQGCGLASAPADWSRGVITLQVFSGVRKMAKAGTTGRGFAADLSAPSAVDERAMVKGGHSASAGAGNKAFTTIRPWRAGESFVGSAPGDPLESSHSIYYRDSFWLLLRGDKDKVIDAAAADSTPVSEGVAKARSSARRLAETTERLAKRPKANEVIDLC